MSNLVANCAESKISKCWSRMWFHCTLCAAGYRLKNMEVRCTPQPRWRSPYAWHWQQFGSQFNKLKIRCGPNTWAAHAVKNLWATAHSPHPVPAPMSLFYNSDDQTCLTERLVVDDGNLYCNLASVRGLSDWMYRRRMLGGCSDGQERTHSQHMS